MNDWRFSELRTTDLAALREVDVSAPFRLSVIFKAHWKGISTTPTKHGPKRPRNEWYDAATAHWAAIKGLMQAKHPTKQRLNSFWFKMYCHGTSKDPDPSALRAAVTSFPFQHKDEGVVQYWQIQDAVRVMWLAAQDTKVSPFRTASLSGGLMSKTASNAGHAQPCAFPYHLRWPSLPAPGLGWPLAIDSKLSSEGSYSRHANAPLSPSIACCLA